MKLKLPSGLNLAFLIIFVLIFIGIPSLMVSMTVIENMSNKKEKKIHNKKPIKNNLKKSTKTNKKHYKKPNKM